MGLLFGVLPAQSAHASIAYTSQERFVEAGNGNGDYFKFEASDFLPFLNAQATVITVPSVVPEQGYPQHYQVKAQQSSMLGATSIMAQGSAQDISPFYHYDNVDQSARSRFETVFELSTTSRVGLTGYLDAYWDYGGNGGDGLALVDLALSREGGPIIYAASTDGSTGYIDSGFLAIDKCLTLAAGSYVLQISASTDAGYYPDDDPPDGLSGDGPVPTFGGSGFARYDVEANSMAVPAPAALTLLLPGLAGVAWLRRRKT